MNRLIQKIQTAERRKHRVRSNISGDRPRLSVHVSNKHITAQIIDDAAHKTLAYVSTIGNKQASEGTLSQRAAWVGTEIAKQAKKIKVSKVVFDRGSKLYHGRIKVLADTARENGLEF